MKAVAFFLVAVALAGCVTTESSIPRASVARVAAPVARAEVAAARSKERVTSARTKIKDARQAVSLLRETATPIQLPAIETVHLSLQEGDRLLEEELVQNAELTLSLGLARDALTDVLLDQEKAAVNQARLEKQLADAKAKARAYLRLKLSIAGLVAAIAGAVVWQFVPFFVGPTKLTAVAVAGGAAFTTVMFLI